MWDHYTRRLKSIWALRIIVALSATGYWALARMDATNGWPPVLLFLGLMLTMAALAVAALEPLRHARFATAWVFGGAILFRLLMVPCGLPEPILPGLLADWRGAGVSYERFLLYDHDVWRYLWDGHTAANGINPYAFAPDSPKLDHLVEDSRWQDIRDNINHPRIQTLYPPAAQVVFSAAYAVAPGSIVAMKLVLIVFDLIALLLLWRCLDQRELAVLYGWNPLVVKAFAGSAHIDAVVVAALALLLWCAARRRPLLGGAALGVAIAAKLAPVVLIPLVWRRMGFRAVAVLGGVAAVFTTPYWGDAGSAAGLMEFARSWRFNAGPFGLVEAIAGTNFARVGMICAVAGISIWASRAKVVADDITVSLGAFLVLGPAVMPWYVTWILPSAIVARRWAWVSFSVLVLAAFLVMVDQVEGPLPLLLEYGTLALLLMAEEYRRGRNR